jgi:flagellar basal-body rod modification protein FlgD
MSAIDGITSGNPSTTAADRIPKQTLGQEDFLKLLITQLTTQDPMSPQKDTDFIAQMSSFSNLEQGKLMQGDISRLREDQQVLQANSLLGRTVEVQVDETTRAIGLVSAVQIEAGTPKVLVGDATYDLSDITAITPTQIK